MDTSTDAAEVLDQQLTPPVSNLDMITNIITQTEEHQTKMDLQTPNPVNIHLVSSTNSPEFTHLTRSLTQSKLIALDAEWKPIRTHNHQQPSCFPTVALLQLACRLVGDDDESLVFLVDLLSIHLPSIYELLKEVFVSPNVLKLGFRFKQDFVYLSDTFCAQGCGSGFDRVEPFMDITSIYTYLQPKHCGRKLSKDTKSLATICSEVLGISLSKELQCSDWSLRPLTGDQKAYAAADAQCLLEIFNVFQVKVVSEGETFHNTPALWSSSDDLGLKEILEIRVSCSKIINIKFNEALDIIRATPYSEYPNNICNEEGTISGSFCSNTKPLSDTFLEIIRKYGERIQLKESDRKPKTSSKKKGKRIFLPASLREVRPEKLDDWEGPPPWELSLGGDGCPKFLCDVMVEGLAKHLRCVGIDAAIPYMKRPEARDLIDQAHKEKRVLLTRDAKLLRHAYLIKSQLYRVKSLLKNEQLLEVIQTFQLKICEDQLMSRCTKCNGRFIQKPLTTEEAVEAAKGFQIIPNCLFNKNLEFWQCMDCNQLYWEGTQYHNAVQKFIDVCKLNE